MAISWTARLALTSAMIAAGDSPVIERLDLATETAWTVDSGGEIVQMLRFHAPRETPARSFRIEAEGADWIWIRGGWARRAAPGVFDLAEMVRPGGNIAVLPARVQARVVMTPRVHVAGTDLRLRSGRLTGRVWIRNTLDNTVNVSLTLSGEARFSAAATIPPGFTQAVVVDASGAWSTTVTLTLDKEEEAMEGGYTYRERVRLSQSNEDR